LRPITAKRASQGARSDGLTYRRHPAPFLSADNVSCQTLFLHRVLARGIGTDRPGQGRGPMPGNPLPRPGLNRRSRPSLPGGIERGWRATRKSTDFGWPLSDWRAIRPYAGQAVNASRGMEISGNPRSRPPGPGCHGRPLAGETISERIYSTIQIYNIQCSTNVTRPKSVYHITSIV
jgi:hypothetical protein